MHKYKHKPNNGVKNLLRKTADVESELQRIKRATRDALFVAVGVVFGLSGIGFLYFDLTNGKDVSAQQQSYAYAPTSSSGATVGAGTNLESLCDQIATSGLADAAAACRSDTTYGVGYDQVNHNVIVPGRTPIPRPLTGPWDVGAYQWPSQPKSPTNVTGTIK